MIQPVPTVTYIALDITGAMFRRTNTTTIRRAILAYRRVVEMGNAKPLIPWGPTAQQQWFLNAMHNMRIQLGPPAPEMVLGAGDQVIVASLQVVASTIRPTVADLRPDMFLFELFTVPF